MSRWIRQTSSTPPKGLRHRDGTAFELSTGCYQALLSLDLSHNNLEDLQATLEELAQLPQLRSLSMSVRSICFVSRVPHGIGRPGGRAPSRMKAPP